MKKFNISAIFTTKDKISKPVKKIAQSVKGLGNTVTKTSRKMSAFGRLSPFKRMSFGAKKLRGNMGDLKNSVKGVSGAMGVMLGAAAIGGIGAISKKILDNADAFAKMSKRTGLSVEELSTFAATAKQAGVEYADFAGSLRRFTKRKEDAFKDGGEALKGYETLGIFGKDLEGKSSMEQIKIISDAVKKLGNETKATRAIQRIFGDEGSKMFNVLMNGSENLTKEMERLGRLGALITPEQAAMAEKFNDSVDELGISFSGLSRSLTFDMIPAMMKSVKGLTTWIVDNRELAKRIMKVVGGVLALAAGFGVLSIAGSAIGGVIGVVKSLTFAVGNLIGMFLFNPIGLAITGIVAATYLLYKTWEPATKFFDNIFGNLTKRYETFKSVFKAEGLVAGFKAAFSGLGDDMFGSITEKFIAFKDYFTTEFPFLTDLISNVVDIGKELFGDLFGGMSADAEDATDIVSSTMKALGLIIHAVFSTIEDIVKGFTLIFDGTLFDAVADMWIMKFNSIKEAFGSVFDFMKNTYSKMSGIISKVSGYFGGDDEQKGSSKATKPTSTFNQPSKSSILNNQKIESTNRIDVYVDNNKTEVKTATPKSKQTQTVFNMGQNRMGGGLAYAF